jgi:chemotaxis family two-component system sensor kinase Cph1
MMVAVCHDLRGPLGTLTMGAALLRESLRGRGAEAAGELTTLGRMERACKRMQALIDDLEDVARVDAGTFRIEPRLVRVREVVQEAADAAQLQAAPLGIEVRVVPTEADISVQLDRRRIQQALGSLVGNALKVTLGGGAITVGAELVDGFVKLYVGDSGAGLGPEQVPHVFDRCWSGAQRSRGATGMGLFMVRTIAEAHGGRAEVLSEAGRGSTFSLLVPRDR